MATRLTIQRPTRATEQCLEIVEIQPLRVAPCLVEKLYGPAHSVTICSYIAYVNPCQLLRSESQFARVLGDLCHSHAHRSQHFWVMAVLVASEELVAAFLPTLSSVKVLHAVSAVCVPL